MVLISVFRLSTSRLVPKILAVKFEVVEKTVQNRQFWASIVGQQTPQISEMHLQMRLTS